MKISFLAFLPIAAAEIIRGVNYYGIETPRKDFDCTWTHPFLFYVDKLHQEGFNHYRIPSSMEYVNEENYSKLDEFIDYLKHYPNTNFTLDMHRIFSSHQAYDIYEGGTTLTQFCDAWVKIIRRHVQNPQFFGVDVFNEYQGTDSLYWNAVLKSVVIKLEESVPDRLVYFCGAPRWGGDLQGINLEDLWFADRIKYTIHKYVFSIGPANHETFNYEADWEASFYKPIRHKISVGEWGFKIEEKSQVRWARRFIAWLRKNNILDSFFWASAGNSGDTNALWKTDCNTFEREKVDIIKTLWKEPNRRNLRTSNNNGNDTVIII